MTRSSGSDDSAKFWANVILLVMALLFYLWFYSVKFEGTGVIADKWTEVSCSTDDDGDTHCSTKYLVQFEDGSILGVFWKPQWDSMVTGRTIKYVARGRNINFFGWRIMQPDIFSYEVIKGP